MRRDLIGVQLEGFLELADRRNPQALFKQAHSPLVVVSRTVLGHARLQDRVVCAEEEYRAQNGPSQYAHHILERLLGAG